MPPAALAARAVHTATQCHGPVRACTAAPRAPATAAGSGQPAARCTHATTLQSLPLAVVCARRAWARCGPTVASVATDRAGTQYAVTHAAARTACLASPAQPEHAGKQRGIRRGTASRPGGLRAVMVSLPCCTTATGQRYGGLKVQDSETLHCARSRSNLRLRLRLRLRRRAPRDSETALCAGAGARVSGVSVISLSVQASRERADRKRRFHVHRARAGTGIQTATPKTSGCEPPSSVLSIDRSPTRQPSALRQTATCVRADAPGVVHCAGPL